MFHGRIGIFCLKTHHKWQFSISGTPSPLPGDCLGEAPPLRRCGGALRTPGAAHGVAVEPGGEAEILELPSFLVKNV